MTDSFKAGDTVRLKTGVTFMTIAEIKEDKAICISEEKGKRNTETFPLVVLTKTPLNRGGRMRSFVV